MKGAKKEKIPQSKSSKLKAFKTVQANFAQAGISPKLVHEPYSCNAKILLGFLFLSMSTTSLFVHIWNNDEVFSELIQSICMGSTGIFIILTLIVLVRNVDELFEFINRVEALLNTSE